MDSQNQNKSSALERASNLAYSIAAQGQSTFDRAIPPERRQEWQTNLADFGKSHPILSVRVSRPHKI